MESDWYDDDENIAASMSPFGSYVAGAMGIDVGYGFSVEAELGVQQAQVDDLEYTTSNTPGLTLTASNVDGEMSALTMMANGRFALFQAGGGFEPYLTGGVGLAHVAIELGGIDDSGFTLAYQASAGVLWPMTERTSLDLGYRYFDTTDVDMETDNGVPFSAEFGSHIALIGLQHKL